MTGGKGFLGRAVCRELVKRGCRRILAPGSSDYNLTKQSEVAEVFRAFPCDMVIHLAAVVGGIEANRKHPGRFLYENLVMGVEVMERARIAGVRKFVAIGTVCAYPKFTAVPFKEEHLWDGYPEETNAPYGLAKKMLLVQSQAYRQEYGFNSIYLLPVNLYGPGDNFDPETSHVIPGLIGKLMEAKRLGRPTVTAWGSGRASREFLYVDDAAEAILLAAERYDEADPVNIGTGEEIAISDLARMIAEEVGFEGEILWDRDRPDGQPRRRLDISRAEELFGFKARTALREGIRRTVQWQLLQGENR